MIELLTNLNWWQWIIFAMLLGALETFMPGAVAIWFAASAARDRPRARGRVRHALAVAVGAVRGARPRRDGAVPQLQEGEPRRRCRSRR
jgi:hypothetical protein